MVSRGWCAAHYWRWRTWGDPAAEVPLKATRPGICSVAGCRNTTKARGWCWAHYRRWHKFGDPTAGGTKKMRVQTNLLDLLEIDGGWWTVGALVLRLNAKHDSVKQALYRLEKSGKVMSRKRDMNRTSPWTSLEWKAC
jgi:hypothetical protein